MRALLTDERRIENEFNNYFSSIADNLAKKIPNSLNHFTNYLSIGSSFKNSIFLKPTSPQETAQIIATLKLKLSCGYDNIPLKVIKYIPPNILEVFISGLSLQNFLEKVFFQSNFLHPFGLFLSEGQINGG